MTRVALIGTGAMGAPMAKHLARACERLTLYDLRRDIAEAAAAEAGAQVADSLAQAGAADVVVTMLPDADAVREALFGESSADALIAGLRPGAIVVDMSSSAPPETRATGARLAERGAVMLDAPVSGGVPRAKTGELTIMLGGDDAAAMDRAGPLLESMGAVHRTGPLGSGHAAKALNNYVSAAGLAAACEALIIGRAFGLDPAVLTDVLNVSTGRNNATERKLHQFILSESFDSGFALALMAKDLRIAASLAEALGLDPPGAHRMAAEWSDAERALDPGADHTEIFRHLRDHARRSDPPPIRGPEPSGAE